MGKEIVICDYHHPGLFQSLMFLFEKRLGFELYRPYGWDWWTEAELRHPLDDVSHGKLSYQSKMLTTPSFITTTDPEKILTLSVPIGRTITLQEAKDRAKEIRYVITSQHDTQEPLSQFVRNVCPHAALIRQCGNPDEHVWYTKNVLSSDLQTYNKVEGSHHAILYHQEFPSAYHEFQSNVRIDTIRQYVNWAHKDKKNREFFLWFKGICKEIGIGIYCSEHGRGGEDGEFDYHSEVADAMRNSDFTLSHKWWDGFGMMVHQSYACGRPVICFEEDYKDKLAGRLMVDERTAVFITNDRDATMKKIRQAMTVHHDLKKRALQRFREVVDWNKEEQEIREWLKGVK